MPVSKYRVRISGPTIAVLTTVREDDHQPKAYLVHEACQSATLRDLPFDDAPEPERGKG